MIKEFQALSMFSPEKNPANPAGEIAFTDNEITNYGRIHAAACGVLVMHSGRNRVAHNHIHDGYYTGISVGWTWGYRESPAKENIIEFNHVHTIGQGMLSDMGGIYTLGPQPGTVVRGNYFHDVAQPSKFAAVSLGPFVISEPLRRMVADLLEPHQVGENRPAAFNSLFFGLELVREFLNCLLIQRRLASGQLAKCLHFRLVRQV